MPQSPIDIKGAVIPPKPHPPLELVYPSFTPVLEHTGWTIQLDTPQESYLKLGDDALYDLEQFHFHEPSEHYIEGKRFALECHFVHKMRGNESLAVVGVMVEVGEGNRLLEQLAQNLPKGKNEKTKLTAEINPLDLIPACLDYYRFMGSLTTEPYLENVLWLILTDSITASPEQIERFHEILQSNARPLQAHKNRDIFICRGGDKC
jgi:carbonic anhydrase